MLRIQLSEISREIDQPIIATIGNFDGVHAGHLQLLEQFNELAKQTNSWRMLITFEPLPHEYFADRAQVIRLPRIGLLRDKVAILRQTNLVDEVVVLFFNHFLAQTAANEFVTETLIKRLNISTMLVGHDFKFGSLALGTIETIRANGIIAHEFAEVRYDNVRISSSLIRELAREQNIEEVKLYLGRNIRYTARVIYGNQLGRKYGVPTINLSLGKVRPVLWGIYTAYVIIDQIRYRAVASIGKNPTVSSSTLYKLEAHLLDVDLNLYGKIATIEILHYLRPELKFDDLDSLFVQIHQDLKHTREYFAGNDLACKNLAIHKKD